MYFQREFVFLVLKTFYNLYVNICMLEANVVGGVVFF